MPRVKNSSSSPPAEPRLAAVPLDRLRPHPANANVMDPTLRAKLRTNLVREGTCPPVVVRPHPDKPRTFQILDGHQRVEVGRELGWEKIPCYIWPCDDATALVLLATLNRLHGEDVPCAARRSPAEAGGADARSRPWRRCSPRTPRRSARRCASSIWIPRRSWPT